MIKSRREQLFTLLPLDALPKLDYAGRLNARLIARAVFRNLNDIRALLSRSRSHSREWRN